ncbi:glycoside hydrolase family 13 protein [Sphingobacterium sp. DR205]|uniref:glycoside hydrolase family 13 protein n=1 Tax=Sphingobacterium sp. DR205 TaxID=2713573 RepID=UPI0013E4DB8C|nr:glycoside hydrolase family 13 protein [Sphingobacterium sp. DR205]QIH35360.1 glycoside hydrolase family 13 protein [Sphingobacterium sp. DR205]
MLKSNRKITTVLVALTVFGWSPLKGQSIQRIEPLNWWVGMENPTLQLVIYGPEIGKTDVQIEDKGIELVKINRVENPNYLFLDVKVAASAKPGWSTLTFSQGKKKLTYRYELKQRDQKVKAQGVNSADLIYLIMPDRFANGNKANDQVKGMLDMSLNRDSMYLRHGGDLEGIIGKLDYLQDLGVTSLWLTPVLTNDMPQASYHGYANTETYHIDPRFGSNDTYVQLGEQLHKRQMKLIFDVVPNHIGSYHWTVKDKPMSDWLNEWPSYTQTSYKDQTVFDPYASADDKKKMVKGWFVPTMPDMNEQNPYVQNYLTQSHIWWIETAAIDGFRIDTYPYNDLDFMAKWTDRIQQEYPNFTFFGETWVHGVANQAYFLGGKHVGQEVDSKLMGVTDFQLNYAIGDALNQKTEWTAGANKLYSTLASDYQYPTPERNVLFLDNHDKDRFFSVVGENVQKYKSAMAWLMTTRGIPQLYYGAEILMKNFSNPDGLLREDFQGGFAGDKMNKFSPEGRTKPEQDMWSYVQTLANYRKQHAVLQTGKTMQYVPEDGIYVYFRYNEQQTVMVVMNCNDVAKEIKLDRFKERNSKVKSYFDIIQKQETSPADNTLKLEAYETKVLELKF